MNDNTTRRFESHSADETMSIAEGLAKTAQRGDIFCLSGELGAGKTVFAKGFARGLAIRADVTSPTFLLVNEYEGGRLALYHFDLYRLNSPEDMYDLGFEEYFFGDGVCLIEWAERVGSLIPRNAIWVDIKRTGEPDDERIIEVRGALE